MTDYSHIAETVEPADQAVVAEAVRDAARRGMAVYPIGGGGAAEEGDSPHLCQAPSGPFRRAPTEGWSGTAPFFSQPGIGLSLARLNGVVDYPAADLTITVEAGMSLAELNNRLATEHQRLPIDVAQPERTSVGGAIAVNAAGPRRYAYGTMRDYLLGFTAVDGVGTVFSGGGRVVKNAAGYNMCRLMAGSCGTLAVITQATLMVRPLPEASALIACDLPDFDLAERLLAQLVHSLVRPTAIELLAGRAGDEASVLGPMLDGCVARLYIGFEGSSAEVEWMAARLREQWNAAGVTTPILASVPAAEAQWGRLAKGPSEERISVLPSAVVETVASLLREYPDCTIQAHAGDGVIRVGHVDDTVARKFVRDADHPHDDHARRRVMQAIKDRFDPQNILNPGRFVYDSD